MLYMKYFPESQFQFSQVHKFENTTMFIHNDKFLFTNTSDDRLFLQINVPYIYFDYKIIDEPIILIFHSWVYNYEHWFFDTLARFHAFFQLKKSIPNIKIGFLKDHYLNYQIEAYNLIFDNEFFNYCILLERNSFYKFSELYVPYNNEIGYKTWFNDFVPIDLKYMVDLFINEAKKYSRSDYPKKIYLSRRNLKGKKHFHEREIRNEDDVVDLLTKFGYQEVFTDELNIKDEINMFQNTEYVITPIGSGCANILFSNQNTKWGIIVSEAYTNCPSMVTTRKEINFKTFTGNIIPQEKVPEISVNYPYICDIISLEQFLKDNKFI